MSDPDGDSITAPDAEPASGSALTWDAATAEPQEAPASTKPDGRQRRLLVVEDSKVIRTVLARLLRKVGYAVEEAGDGHEALTALRRSVMNRTTFDLVMLDIMMPGMDGMETLENLRQRPQHKNLPVMIMSAKNDRETVLKAARFKVAGYILKPFQNQRVLEQVAKVLGLPDASATAPAAASEAEAPTETGEGSAADAPAAVVTPQTGAKES